MAQSPNTNISCPLFFSPFQQLNSKCIVFHLMKFHHCFKLSRGCIRMGVFCCLTVFLVKRLHWTVLLPSGEPILIAKNCIKFCFPKYPCSITLIDSFSYIEVYVSAPPDFGKKLCPMIRDQLLHGIETVCDMLHYNNDTPQISIFCPCKKFRERVHLAEINEETGCWICSYQAGVGENLLLTAGCGCTNQLKHHVSMTA